MASSTADVRLPHLDPFWHAVPEDTRFQYRWKVISDHSAQGLTIEGLEITFIQPGTNMLRTQMFKALPTRDAAILGAYEWMLRQPRVAGSFRLGDAVHFVASKIPMTKPVCGPCYARHLALNSVNAKKGNQ